MDDDRYYELFPQTLLAGQTSYQEQGKRSRNYARNADECEIVGEVNADLTNLQQNYPDSIAAAQATLMAAATEYDARRYDVAEGHLNWVLKNQKAPLVQALAAQRLGIVLLQQKKYDAAIAALNTKVEADFEPLLLEAKGDVYAAQNKTKDEHILMANCR